MGGEQMRPQELAHSFFRGHGLKSERDQMALLTALIEEDRRSTRESVIEDEDAELAALRERVAEMESGGPGTPSFRLNGLATWAEETLGHDPLSSRGFESTIRNRFDDVKAKLAKLREAVVAYFDAEEKAEPYEHDGNHVVNAREARQALNEARERLDALLDEEATS